MCQDNCLGIITKPYEDTNDPACFIINVQQLSELPIGGSTQCDVSLDKFEVYTSPVNCTSAINYYGTVLCLFNTNTHATDVTTAERTCQEQGGFLPEAQTSGHLSMIYTVSGYATQVWLGEL